MDIPLYNQDGTSKSNITIADRLFSAPADRNTIYQVVTSQMSNKRVVLAHAKTRSEVRGGGKKPWRQKGTGNARHGSIRSPIWIGGGVTHGPSRDANFKKKIPTTIARKALAAVLSDRAQAGRLLIVDTLSVTSGKTKDGARTLAALAKGLRGYESKDRVLLVLPGTADDAKTRRATDNLPRVDTVPAKNLNALTVLAYPYVIATQDAIAVMEKTFLAK